MKGEDYQDRTVLVSTQIVKTMKMQRSKTNLQKLKNAEYFLLLLKEMVESVSHVLKISTKTFSKL